MKVSRSFTPYKFIEDFIHRRRYLFKHTERIFNGFIRLLRNKDREILISNHELGKSLKHQPSPSSWVDFDKNEQRYSPW